MGYSCTNAAMKTMENVMAQIKKEFPMEGSNTWVTNEGRYFYEIGREQKDGAITGQIMKFISSNFCVRFGNFKISAAGKVVTWPGMPKKFWN